MFPLLAHTAGGYGWGGPLQPWEIHPILVHFPIAFLLGWLALDLFGWRRGSEATTRTATGLLVAGVLTGVAAALAGLLSFFTVPESHTETAHVLMYWHLGIQAAALVLFGGLAWFRWRRWDAPPALAARAVGWVAAVLLIIGSAIGGYIVYHGGAGIDASIMAPHLHEGMDPNMDMDKGHEH